MTQHTTGKQYASGEPSATGKQYASGEPSATKRQFTAGEQHAPARQFTTGELAKLCDITVRTVQFYDSKGLLKPSDLTDGGRRLYSEADLARMRVICFLKDLGFSLKDVSALLTQSDTSSAFQLLLDAQQKELTSRVEKDQAALERLEELRRSVAHFGSLTPNDFGVIADIMDSKKKLRNVHLTMVLVGIVMDVVWIVPLVFAIMTGVWWPFALGLGAAIVAGVFISRYYILHTAYVCPEDHTIFRAPLMQNLLAPHTPSMRKLTCPTCGKKLYCLEIYAPNTTPKREGKYLVWREGSAASSALKDEQRGR